MTGNSCIFTESTRWQKECLADNLVSLKLTNMIHWVDKFDWDLFDYFVETNRFQPVKQYSQTTFYSHALVDFRAIFGTWLKCKQKHSARLLVYKSDSLQTEKKEPTAGNFVDFECSNNGMYNAHKRCAPHPMLVYLFYVTFWRVFCARCTDCQYSHSLAQWICHLLNLCAHTSCRQSERWNRKPTKLSEINREVAQEKVNQSNKQKFEIKTKTKSRGKNVV